MCRSARNIWAISYSRIYLFHEYVDAILLSIFIIEYIRIHKCICIFDIKSLWKLVYTCDFCCNFMHDFLLLIDVNEWTVINAPTHNLECDFLQFLLSQSVIRTFVFKNYQIFSYLFFKNLDMSQLCKLCSKLINIFGLLLNGNVYIFGILQLQT